MPVLGISNERSSSPAGRDHSDSGRLGGGGTGSHTDCELEEAACDWRGYQFRSNSRTESVINTKTEDLRERVLALTAGKGVDAVLNAVGRQQFE